MIVGVGGQGTLLASRVLGRAIISQGYDVKISEVHGMSQRGGAVVTYVKYGGSVASPTIEKGEADLILAFELLEAARWFTFLKPEGKMIINTQQIDPMPVVIGSAVYPDGILESLSAAGADIIAFDALQLAESAGSAKAVNVVLIGAMAGHMSFPVETWQTAIRETVPVKFLEMNLKAFELGYNTQK